MEMAGIPAQEVPQQAYAPDPVQQQQQYAPDPVHQQALQYQRSMLVPQQPATQWATAAPMPHPQGERRFKCPDPDCPMSTMGYTSSVGLYQHKRSKHPWLIKQRPRRESYDDEECRFACPAPGCTKAYRTSTGLYQHKRSKHPWLIKQRERGYHRPAYRAMSKEDGTDGVAPQIGMAPQIASQIAPQIATQIAPQMAAPLQQYPDPPQMAQQYPDPPQIAQQYQDPPQIAQQYQDPPQIAQQYQDPPQMAAPLQQ